MKTRDLNQLASQLDLPGFEVRGAMLFMQPVKQVLRGLYFEGSGFDPSSFYLWAFFMLLCMPTRQVNFNLGKRIRDFETEGWNKNDPVLVPKLVDAIKREASPFLECAHSIQSATETAISFQVPSRPNLHIQETISYGLIRSGQFDRARVELNKLKQIADLRITWQREVSERAGGVYEKLETSPEQAQALLIEWENQTASDLGIRTR